MSDLNPEPWHPAGPGFIEGRYRGREIVLESAVVWFYSESPTALRYATMPASTAFPSSIAWGDRIRITKRPDGTWAVAREGA